MDMKMTIDMEMYSNTRTHVDIFERKPVDIGLLRH
jgi:hypothetical protein